MKLFHVLIFDLINFAKIGLCLSLKIFKVLLPYPNGFKLEL